jgi:hypothetical protein
LPQKVSTIYVLCRLCIQLCSPSAEQNFASRAGEKNE